jgi:predicted acyltransferase
MLLSLPGDSIGAPLAEQSQSGLLLFSLSNSQGTSQDSCRMSPTTTTPVDSTLPDRKSASAPTPARLASLDAYRGFVMFLMMAEVLRLGSVARAKPDSPFWQFLAHHQDHVEWIGCSLHDLIQPSFSFLVGVALPFSIASRVAKGQSQSLMTLHAIWRSVVLVLLGVFLRSIDQSQTYWTFEDTLSQIGLGYAFLFMLGFRSMRAQWMGYWAAFALYPLPGAGFEYSKVGVPNNWPHLMTGTFAAHWDKNSNLAWAFDTWFMNLFPREKQFLFNGGGYSTLSFIPTLGTMILGLIAGGVIRSGRTDKQKFAWLATAGVIGILAGAALGWLGVCPVVKRIWTPTWTVFSGGWCFLLMAAFYFVVDMRRIRQWAFPLIVVGMNSIAAYCIAHLFESFIGGTLKTHFGTAAFKVFGEPYEPLFHGAFTLLVMWLILYWMYKRKLFLRI